MKIRLIKPVVLIVLGVIISTSGHAQAPIEKSVFWKISGNGLEAPSHLFGTIHIVCVDDFELSNEVVETMKKSEKFILELDMDDPKLTSKMQRLMVSAEMRNIQDDLSEEDIATLNAFLRANFGQGLAQIGVLKPFALSAMVTFKAFECETKQYETEIVSKAIEFEKEIEGLETIDFQMSLLDGFSREMQIDALMKQVKNPEATALVLNQIVEAYKLQDLSRMQALFDQYEDYEGFNEKMLYERNEKWIPNIEKYAKEGKTFIAVGAGHLAGDKGLISLLRARGYTLTPVK